MSIEDLEASAEAVTFWAQLENAGKQVKFWTMRFSQIQAALNANAAYLANVDQEQKTYADSGAAVAVIANQDFPIEPSTKPFPPADSDPNP